MSIDRAGLTRDLLADLWRLCRSYDHSERLDNGHWHRSRHAGLLDQLREAEAVSTVADEERTGGAIHASRPPLVEEPFVVLLAARGLARELAVACGGRPRPTIEGDLSTLAGRSGELNDDALLAAVVDIAALRRRAEEALSWQLRSRRITGACPACQARDQINVRLDEHGPEGAWCGACSTRWDRSELGILAGAMQEEDA